MPKIKLTKGELKRQRDCLRQYQRYLPTLQLKKQQLQMEILRQHQALAEKARAYQAKSAAIAGWSGLLREEGISLTKWVRPRDVAVQAKNIAGIEIPLFCRADFLTAEYDLFLYPLWVDTAIDQLRLLAALRQEMLVLERGVEILQKELRVTNQRVNLFEKVKIPEAEEAIRAIRIYVGDQLANAVARSKIAKRKIEELACL
jgi:V/A-type H+-transporting ATPase subunit D